MRQLADFFEHGGFGTIADVGAEIVEVVEAELVHHLDEAAAADVVAGRERVGVADGIDGKARVGADHRHQRLVDLAFLDQAQEGNVQPLHEHVGGVGTEADAADVDEVAGAREQPDELALVEARRRDDEVVEVTGAHPGVVGDVGVTGLHRVEADVTDEVLDRLRHRIDVAGRAGDGLREHPPLAVEDAGGKVAGFAHDRREGGAQQRLALLLDDRDEPVPHDLALDVARGSLICSADIRRAP